MKKLILVVTALSLMGALLAGCAKEAEPAADGGAATTAGATDEAK